MTIKIHKYAAASLAAMALAQGPAAYAQATAASGADAAAQPSVGEIIVTAQKRSENLQKTAISIDAVRADELTKTGISNANQLQDIVPDVKFTVGDEMTINIRGLGTVDLNGGVDSAVAYAQDGIYLSHPAALMPVLFDMKRIEVLLGPQGTLYGRNSNGGVVNFISADPDFKFGGHVQAGYGNYNAITSDAALNVPVSDTLALRVAFGSEKHDPYQRDGTYDAESYATRVKLLYKPTTNLSVLLAGDFSFHRTSGTTYGWVCPPGIVSVPACSTVHDAPYTGVDPVVPGVEGSRDRVWGVSATVNYDMNWATLTSLTAYKHYNFTAVTSPGLVNGINEFEYHHNEQDDFFTQELRIGSPSSSKIKWVGGLFYSHEVQPFAQQFFYHENTIVQTLGAPNGYYQEYPVNGTKYTSAAVFADLSVPVLATVRLRGGARETSEVKDATGEILTGIEGFGLIAPPLVNPSRESGAHFTWNVGADWDITPRNLFYATVSTGYKSGGLNNLPPSTGLTTYAPEKITAVEVGIKNRFFNNQLQINASLFHYHYENYQSYVFYQPSGGPLVGATLFPTVNSQTATFEGGELQGIWQVTTNDRLTFGYNYLHDRFGTFYLALPYTTPINESGFRVPQTPESTFSAGIDHTFHIAGGWTFDIGANTQFVSSYLASGSYTQYSAANVPIGTGYFTQGSFHKTNLNASLASGNGWTLSAFVRNIENKATINTVAGGFPTFPNLFEADADLDPPRTYGIVLRKDF